MEPSGDMKNKESRVGNMAVRDEIIKTLEENRGTYLSGEQLAKKLSVSRAAVWKAIRKLQEDGFAIEGVNNKGYKLAEDTDVLSVQGTAKYLDVECPVRLEVFRCINSTNLHSVSGRRRKKAWCLLRWSRRTDSEDWGGRLCRRQIQESISVSC